MTEAPSVKSPHQGIDRFIRDQRDQLSQAVTSHQLPASELPRRYSDVVDGWLSGLLEQTTKGNTRGYALVAVGGYGRRELSPSSDLDLVLVHRHRRHYEKVADSIWYAIWDTGISLDHSVRTRGEVLSMARQDLRVILGLLDARVVGGDTNTASPLFPAILELWQKESGQFLPMLNDSVRKRHKSSGELAFLLEPDLKQSAGGLRDAAVLRALGLALPSLAPLVNTPAINDAERLILSARVAVQCQSSTSSDRLALQEQDQVAEILGYVDADALMAAIAHAGRTIAVASNDVWHRAEILLRPSPGGQVRSHTIGAGIVVRDGEIALGPDAAPSSDPTLIVRVALAAAQRNALIERESLDRLEADAVAPSEPWNEELRREFIALLGSGDALIPAIEALDQRHLFERLIPEWSAVRNKPQRNAYHRFTVDRHLLEAIARAGEFLDRVERPDLLLLGAMFHDIGKGFPGDHSEVGQEITTRIATRMGYPPEDVNVLVRLVAYHLVLPEFATRRDLDDPSTASLVARLIEDRQTLFLLAALTEADGLATGTSAWGPWKAELVASLVERVGRVIDGHPIPPPPESRPSPEQLELLQAGKLAVRASGHHVTVIAPDRPGLFAAVAGTFALNGCNVKRATAAPGTPEMAIEIFDIEPAFDREPEWSSIEQDIEAWLQGTMLLEDRLADQDRAYAGARRPSVAHPAQMHVLVDNGSSELASIIEVRAPDRLGLLHQITAAIASADLNVISAIVDTLGHEVIDTFYVRERSGEKIEPTRIEHVRALVLSVIQPIS